MFSYFAATIVAFSPAANMQAGPQWQSDYGKALEATRGDERPLLVVLDNPADEKSSIDEGLLTNNQEDLNAYQLCHVDVSTEYGQKVAERFNATEFPHTAIIDKHGETILFKQRGQFTKGKWNGVLSKFKSGTRSAQVRQTTFFRGVNNGQSTTMPLSTDGTIFSPGFMNSGAPANCPSCQRQALGF